MKSSIAIIPFFLFSFLSISQSNTQKRLELTRLKFENKYKSVGQFDSITGIATVYNYPNMGYIDTVGRLILPLGAYQTFDFNDGMGICRDIRMKTFKVIDKTGKIIKEFKKINYLSAFKNGVAVIRDASDGYGKYGVMDFNENIIIKCQYSHLEKISKKYYEASDFKKGTGIINSRGDTIIPLKYIIDSFDTLSLQFIGYQKDIGHAIFDSSGRVRKYLGKKIYSESSYIEGNHYYERNGVIILRDRFSSTEAQYSLVNVHFDTIVSKGRFLNLSNTNEGLIKFSEAIKIDKSNGGVTYQYTKSGFINTKGEIVIAADFDFALYFTEGLCSVRKGNKYGYIDQKGKLVIPLSFDYALPFKNGYAKVQVKDKFFIINKEGNKVLDSKSY